MGVDLGRRNTFMTKQLLDVAKVGATVKQMGRETVAKLVWVDVSVEAAGAGRIGDDTTGDTFIEAAPACTEKNKGYRGVVCRYEGRADCQPRFKSRDTATVHWHEADLAAFAKDTHAGFGGGRKDKMIDGKAAGFADPQASRIKQLDEGFVAQGFGRVTARCPRDEVDGGRDIEDFGKGARLARIDDAIHR